MWFQNHEYWITLPAEFWTGKAEHGMNYIWKSMKYIIYKIT